MGLGGACGSMAGKGRGRAIAAPRGLCENQRVLRQLDARSLAPSRDDARLVWATIRAFTPGAWLGAVLAGAAVLLFIGVTTAVVQNELFARMTPVRTQDYVFWLLTAGLAGLIAGTFVLSNVEGNAGKAVAGGFFADIAIGCPICNKIVVAVLGTSGALTFFGPLQLLIGAASIGLLALALVFRARSIAGVCPLPAAAA